MTTETKISKTQLAYVLSSLVNEPRSPANSAAALRAIDKEAASMGLTRTEVLGTAQELLDGRQSPEGWRLELQATADDAARAAAEVAAEAGPGAEADAAAPAAKAPRKRKEPVSEEDKAARAQARFENSKLGQLVAMLERPEGATVAQIAEVTGWQNHSIRGAISGALKKKMGLTVTTERVREVGPEKAGAPGSTTIYRIAPAESEAAA